MDAADADPLGLRQSLVNVARLQRQYLIDLEERCSGEDPRFGEAFRTWQLTLTNIRLHLLQVEQQLLHYLMVPDEFRPWRELSEPTRIAAACHRRWQDLLSPWLYSLHIDTCYRRIAQPLDPRAEAATADLLTDLATVAAVCDSTASTLSQHVEGCEDALLEELAFYHLLSPWKERATASLLDCLRWFDIFLSEHEII